MKQFFSRIFLLCALFTIFFVISCTTQQRVTDRHDATTKQVNQAQSEMQGSFVDQLLAKMTLAEKVGQMNLYNGFYDVTGPTPQDGDAKKKYEDIEHGRVGAMLNVASVKESTILQKIAVEKTRLGIPLLFGFDVIHGYKTIFPIPLAEAASWDLAKMEQGARIAAIEASAVGIHWTYAPMVDVGRDPRWGRVMEGAGEDPYLNSVVAVARVKGFQGDDLSKNNTIAACAKHFAGYAFAEGGRDYNTAEMSRSTLHNVVLPPFKAAKDAGVATFMNSFNDLNGIPATADAYLQRDILKGKWNFDGFVVSDWGSIVEMINHGFAKDGAEAARYAALGGSDMDMESYLYDKHLDSLVQSGAVPMDYIDDAVRRILQLKYDLGLFDDPYQYADTQREKELLHHPDHHAAALEMAKSSIVLLKNGNNMLPLAKNGLKIAVIGDLADDKNSPLGNWRLAADEHSAVSILEGLQAYEGNTLRFAKGVTVAHGQEHFVFELEINDSDTSGMAEAIKVAKGADVVLMALGEHGLQSGEARSRAFLDLPGLQQELLEAVMAVNKNVVLLNMSGRPLDLTWADAYVPAILQVWHLGSQMGHAVAQTVFGDNNPSGKLPMTFPRNVNQIPVYYNHKVTGRPGPKKEVFWSHYIDETNDPLYPFGYGLSYTTFEYSDMQVIQTSANEWKASVTISNTGDHDGEEVVQLYIRDLFASNTRPIKELKAFEKISLNKGETKTVEFMIGDKELGFYTNDGEWVVEPGDFDIMIGKDKQRIVLK